MNMALAFMLSTVLAGPATTPADPDASADAPTTPDAADASEPVTAAPAPEAPTPAGTPSADPFAAADAPPENNQAPVEPKEAPDVSDVDAYGHALPPKPPAPNDPKKASKRSKRQRRPDRPIRWRLDFFASGALTVAPHPSFLFFDSDRTLAGPGVGVRFDVPVVGDRLFMGGGVHWQRMSSQRGDAWATLYNDLTLDETEVFGRASVVAVEGVDLFVDLSGGLDVWRYQVDSSARSPSGRTLGGVFGALGGLALYLPKAWLPPKGAARTTAGFEMSAGYRYRSPLDVELDPQSGEDPIRTRSVNFGEVRTSGFSSVFSFFLRVM